MIRNMSLCQEGVGGGKAWEGVRPQIRRGSHFITNLFSSRTRYMDPSMASKLRDTGFRYGTIVTEQHR